MKLKSDDQIDTVFEVGQNARNQDEEFEVMGGGDAVLSAVIASWLGLSRLGTALIFGFLAGTAMGACYLIYELFKQKLLAQCVKPALIGAGILVALSEGMLATLAHVGSQDFFSTPWWQLGLAAAVCGGLLAVVSFGSRISKPFPFGPALAAGAVVAMFYDPLFNLAGGA